MSFRVLGIGEILWDLLPSGPQLGGAPANFAGHARALGADAHMITRVGSDDLGREILRRFEAAGLGAGLVQVDPVAPTGTVTVSLTGDGLPNFVIHEGVAWDRLEAAPEALEAVGKADAVCFGTLAQRSPASKQAVQAFVGASPEKAWRVFDINLRQTYFSRDTIARSLHLANVVKLNEDELQIMASLFALTGDVRAQIERLASEFSLRLIALTRGPRGSVLFQAGRWSEYAAQPVQIVDTIGAGDAFTAALTLGLLHGVDLDKINRIANDVAGYVCSHAGATPPLPSRFAALLSG